MDKSLQLIGRSCDHGWNLQVPDLELEWLDPKIGHWDSSSSDGHQGNMSCWEPCHQHSLDMKWLPAKSCVFLATRGILVLHLSTRWVVVAAVVARWCSARVSGTHSELDKAGAHCDELLRIVAVLDINQLMRVFVYVIDLDKVLKWNDCEAFCQWFSLVTNMILSLMKLIGKLPHSWPKNHYSW